VAVNLGGGEDEPIVDINITPLVDIILVVLIIFMVTATYIVAPSIKVNLPDAATGEPTETSSLGIHLGVDGELSLDGEIISEQDLRDFVRAEALRDMDTVCLIAADREVSHGRVVSIIDLVRQEGIAKFAININPAESVDLQALDNESTVEVE
jgi:biopolymer transport protein ExbD